MISSRRVAREWALKILYQADVGKMPVEESQSAALERLRREFVHRGSRAAGGSFVEEYCLDAITAQLVDFLPEYNSALDGAIRQCLAQLFDNENYWRRLEVEFTFSRQSFAALLETPRHARPIVLPIESADLPQNVEAEKKLSASDRIRLLQFLQWARIALPEIALRAFTREARSERPEGANLKATLEYLQVRWREFPESMAGRWLSTGAVLEKHSADWMRVASFTLRLVRGVTENHKDLDATLQTLATGWSIDRQVSVDRNILRMAAFELTHLEGVPASATINEAVELAKKYSTTESGRFVNGVLGTLATQLDSTTPAETDEGDESVLLEELADLPLDMDEIAHAAADEEELAPT